ncbi:MAG TPA: DUF2520 domain-containing protein [Rhodoglobus sp.]|nr:DUF2520 domain-containing protein [Rhodoglobus sp.]
MTPAGRLGVGVIGGGRVGPVIATALGGAGHAVVGVATADEANRERVEAMLPGVPILPIPELVERSELVVIAIPEDQLEPLVAGLAATGAWQPGQLVLHTAPGVGTGVLAPAARAGAIPLAVHPAMVFTGTSLDLVRLRESWCAVTAPNPVLPIAQALVLEMGAEPLVVAEADRPAWGEAVATATAFSAEIVRQSASILAGIGVESPRSVLGPVLRSSLETALGSPPPLDAGPLELD